MRWILVLGLLMLPDAAYATQVQEVVSGKGVKAWLVEEHSLPLLAVKIMFRDSGTAYDAKGKGGRSTMTAGMLDEGAGELDATAFSKALEDKAIGIGFNVDDDGFYGWVTTTSEFNKDAFGFLGMALNHPRFDAVALERVRGQMLSALAAQEKEPEYLLQRKWVTLLYGDHPYANPDMGTAESVKALKAEDLKQYMQAYLTRDRLVVAVVGDITPAELKPLLDAQFGSLPGKAAPDVTVADVELPKEPHQLVVDSDIPQTVVLFGTQGIKRDDKAFYDGYVMNYLLGGGNLSSKLFVELREKRGLTYGVSTDLAPMRHGAVWSGGFATRDEKVGEALAALRSTLERFAAEGPSDEEMVKAKQYLTGSFVLGLGSNRDIASYLINMQINQLGPDYFDKRNGYMNAVTKAGVQNIAKQLVDMKRLQVVMVGRPMLAVAPESKGAKP